MSGRTGIRSIRIWYILSLAIFIGMIAATYFLGTNVDRNFIHLGIVAIPFLILAFYWHGRLKDAGLRRRLNETWGSVDLRVRDMNEIDGHFRLTRDDLKRDDALDDRTWSDLDMDAVFSQIDRTLTAPGEQILYRLLRRPSFDDRDIEERRSWITSFSRDKDFRDNSRFFLAKLGRNEGEGLAEFLWGEPPRTISVPFPLFVLPLSLVSFFVLILAGQGWAWFGFVAAFVGSMFAHFRAKRMIGEYGPSFRYLGRMIVWARKLAGLAVPEIIGAVESLSDDLRSVAGMPRKTAWIALGGNDPFFEYINVLFLTELRAYHGAVKLLQAHRHALQRIFEWTGFFDAMASIASYRTDICDYCEPRFAESGPWLELENAVHPLIKNPVPNSLALKENGLLITGSNMSGKTTFLKTIGVNAVLAQTICTCRAETYRARFFRIATLIGRNDNLVEGKSYYLDEILALKRLLNHENEAVARLYLLDELFRGTNSVERIAAAVEVLAYLAKGNGCTVASTHDLEVTKLVGFDYSNFHFEETIGDDGLAFNYKLMPGSSATRNAVQLLRFVGYPPEIVEAAERRVFFLQPKE
ncbi:MAG: hypothetical protein JW843_06535 [Candidatus Aminicenantes bacterium]|nr:hypothetical protein [Candidatus Aminicenantes bacterium]